MSIIDLKNCLFEVRDGSSTVKKIVVHIGKGNLTFDEKQNVDYILDRGVIDEVRLGDQVPMAVKFEFGWEFITGQGKYNAISIEDALKGGSRATGWVTASADACQPYSVNLYMYDLIPCGTLQQETILLPEFRWETLTHDPKAGTISCDGKCNALQATAVRGTAAT